MPLFVFLLVSIVIILDCLSNIFVPSELQDAQEAVQKAEAAQKRAADIASGAVQMNGRELFQHEPWVFDNNIY
jgi:hypothetical protein